MPSCHLLRFFPLACFEAPLELSDHALLREQHGYDNAVEWYRPGSVRAAGKLHARRPEEIIEHFLVFLAEPSPEL
jgi:hypothetical protein